MTVVTAVTVAVFLTTAIALDRPPLTMARCGSPALALAPLLSTPVIMATLALGVSIASVSPLESGMDLHQLAHVSLSSFSHYSCMK